MNMRMIMNISMIIGGYPAAGNLLKPRPNCTMQSEALRDRFCSLFFQAQCWYLWCGRTHFLCAWRLRTFCRTLHWTNDRCRVPFSSMGWTRTFRLSTFLPERCGGRSCFFHKSRLRIYCGSVFKLGRLQFLTYQQMIDVKTLIPFIKVSLATWNSDNHWLKAMKREGNGWRMEEVNSCGSLSRSQILCASLLQLPNSAKEWCSICPGWIGSLKPLWSSVSLCMINSEWRMTED